MVEILAAAYYICSYTNKIPAITKAFKTKKTSDYSIFWAILNLIGAIAWTLYVLLTKQALIVKLGCIIDFALISIWMILVLRYSKKQYV